IGDDIVEVAHGGLAQPVLVIGGRMPKASPRDHAVAVAEQSVADRAVDIEALASSLEQLRRHRNGKVLRILRHPQVLFGQAVSGHRSRHQRPRRPAVVKKRAGTERLVPRLIGHLLSAAAREAERDAQNEKEAAAARSVELFQAASWLDLVNKAPRKRHASPTTRENARWLGDRTSDRGPQSRERNGRARPAQTAAHETP